MDCLRRLIFIPAVREGRVGRIVNLTIVPLAVLATVIAFNYTINIKYSDNVSDNGSSLNTISWTDKLNSRSWYLQAVQQTDGYVLLYADLRIQFLMNAAVVFAQIPERVSWYSLQNCGIRGRLAVDFDRGPINGTYNVTIFLPEHPNKKTVSEFTQAGGYQIYTEVNDTKWYLTVRNSIVVAANLTETEIEAQQFYIGGISNTELSKYCIPRTT